MLKQLNVVLYIANLFFLVWVTSWLLQCKYSNRRSIPHQITICLVMQRLDLYTEDAVQWTAKCKKILTGGGEELDIFFFCKSVLFCSKSECVHQ